MPTEAQKRADRNFVKRQLAKGLKRMWIWVTPQEEAALKGVLQALRQQDAQKDAQKEAA